jgi:hypothetical protein
LRHIVFAGLAAIYVAFGLGAAIAQEITLVGSWRSCESSNRCNIVFSFMPDGRVIKQSVLLGQTVTGDGHYSRDKGLLKITWTRISPERVCGPSVDHNGQEQCLRPAEQDVEGPLQFDGFNTVLWNISGGKQLRLERRED